jgi:hypothetical protein
VFSIYLNGQHLSDLRQAERFMTRVQSGPALLELRMYNLSQTVTPVQVETSFDAGKRYVYRAGLDANLMLHLHKDLALTDKR